MAELRNGSTINNKLIIHEGLSKAYLNENEIWHEGNFDPNNIDSSSHNHNGTYAKITGDSLTGSFLWAGDKDYKGLYWGSKYEDADAHNATWAYIRQGTTAGQLEIGSDNKIQIYETDSRILAIDISTNSKTLDAKGGLLEDGVALSDKYSSINHDHDDTYALIHDHPYDDYGSWKLKINSETTSDSITSGEIVNLIEGNNVSITKSGTDITIDSSYTDTNYYLSDVSGSGNGTVTFDMAGGKSDITWDASHTHSEYEPTHDHPYLPLSGGTITGSLTINDTLALKIGEGLEFRSDNNYFGTNLDARIIRMIDGNSSGGNVDGGLVIEGYTGDTSKELLTLRTNGQFKLLGNQIWHEGNFDPNDKSDVHSHPYDDYGNWKLGINTETSGEAISSGELVRLKDSSNVTLSRSGGDITISSINYYLNDVSGSGNGTVTFDMAGGFDNITWNASHNHDGTTNNTYHIDSNNNGPKLKNSSGTLEIRNTSDDDYANLKVNNLTVMGTTTTVNSETVNIADNIIVLNSNVTESPTEDGGIEIERGTGSNATLIWNENDDYWEAQGYKIWHAGNFNPNSKSDVHSHPYDNYESWQIGINDETSGKEITKNGLVKLVAGSNISLLRSGGEITITSTAAGNNYYLNDVSGSGNGTVTFDMAGGKSDITWDASHDHDNKYYTESESDSRFVNVSGDSMSGDLTVGNSVSLGGNATMQWNDTTKSIDFVFVS